VPHEELQLMTCWKGTDMVSYGLEAHPLCRHTIDCSVLPGIPMKNIVYMAGLVVEFFFSY